MGIYVKGMEMPKKCLLCPLQYLGFCQVTKTDINSDLGRRADDCPLVEVEEPHGNLIDKDILEEDLINGIKAGNYEEGYEHYVNINNMDDCVACVRYADTVIEAER